jgi:16S rRNA (uracil1498-N3)-methyltransferase
MTRLYLPVPFAPGAIVALPAAAARHVQVLRLQPGDPITLFNGSDGADWHAEIVRIGRRDVEVRVDTSQPVERELPDDVTLALGVPANDRMDTLVEKAGELGATAIQPLVCERSVLRLAGDRAEARRSHWQAVAAAASEQCGRARVARVLPMLSLTSWLQMQALPEPAPQRRIVLSLAPASLDAQSALGGAGAADDAAPAPPIVALSGPEGGLTADEESAAVALGFVRVSLGPRILRADTAPLALLAWLAVRAGVPGRGAQ